MTGKNPAVLCFFCLDSARVCANTAARHAYWWLSADGGKKTPAARFSSLSACIQFDLSSFEASVLKQNE